MKSVKSKIEKNWQKEEKMKKDKKKMKNESYIRKIKGQRK